MHVGTLSNIQFPVYEIGLEKPQELDGVLFYHRVYKDKEILLIVDDKNLDGDSLAKRRIEILSNNGSLSKINKAIFFLGDLIKLATPRKWFIDSNGILFIYTKTKRVNLIIKSIKQIIPINTGGAIIEVEAIQTRFKCLYAPHNEKFAGLLKLAHAYILYGLYEEKPEETWRLI